MKMDEYGQLLNDDGTFALDPDQPEMSDDELSEHFPNGLPEWMK